MFQCPGWMRKNFIHGNFSWRVATETWCKLLQNRFTGKTIECSKHLHHIAIEKDILSELNRCIFQISLKYIKLVIPKILFILVLCSFNFYCKITWPPHSPNKITPQKFLTPTSKDFSEIFNSPPSSWIGAHALDDCYWLFVDWMMNHLYLLICQHVCFLRMLHIKMISYIITTIFDEYLLPVLTKHFHWTFPSFTIVAFTMNTIYTLQF